MKETACRICGFKASGKELANHIKKVHGLKSEDYTIKYIFDDKRPVCEICGEQTRYSAFTFKRYCKKCIALGSKISGREGGKSPAWNRGKTKHTDERITALSNSVLGQNNPFWGKKHTEETKQRISQTKMLEKEAVLDRIKERQETFEILTPINDYKSRQQQYLEFACKICGGINRKTLQSFERGSQCVHCFPVTVSQGESEIAHWLHTQSFNVQTSVRNVISPKELDIFLPQQKTAIEFNGLYWHSELSPRKIDRYLHLNKTVAAHKEGIRLIHVFSDEWALKRDIVQSMILHRVGKTQHRLFARKLKIDALSVKERQQFFNASHISGDAPATIAYALFAGKLPICCISLRKPRQKKWLGYLEIARFATLTYHHVPGGLERLMQSAVTFAKTNGYRGIVTYADRRFGEGAGYGRVGFKNVGTTGLDYWYTDGSVRLDRFTMRATAAQTERERAASNSLGRVWGCGSQIWLLQC